MHKNSWIIAVIIVIIAIVLGALAAVATLGIFENDDESDYPSNVKIGKYYKVGGTDKEYIEVFSDGTVQMFGYDHLEATLELMNAESADVLSDSAKEQMETLTEYFSSRHSYEYTPEMKWIAFKGSPENDSDNASIYGLVYRNENTIVFDERNGYIYTFRE